MERNSRYGRNIREIAVFYEISPWIVESDFHSTTPYCGTKHLPIEISQIRHLNANFFWKIDFKRKRIPFY